MGWAGAPALAGGRDPSGQSSWSRIERRACTTAQDEHPEWHAEMWALTPDSLPATAAGDDRARATITSLAGCDSHRHQKK